MRLYIFETEQYEREYLAKGLKSLKPVFVEAPLNFATVEKYKNAELISVFINSDLKHKVLPHLSRLKHIAIRATGFDHVDMDTAKRNGVVVSNVPAYGTTTVAEHAIALLLSLSRKVVPSIERVRSASFDFHGLTGFDLEGKTLGLVGFGKIAKHVARIAKGLGMHILAYDVYKDVNAAHELGVRFVPLSSIWKRSDVISFHTPYMKSTHHMLNVKTLPLLKKGVVIINTARGALIEDAALIRGLRTQIIAGAGLDVVEFEHDIKTNTRGTNFARRHLKQLVTNPNVLVTPHNAFNSREAIQRILQTTVENIKAFSKGKPINVVSN